MLLPVICCCIIQCFSLSIRWRQLPVRLLSRMRTFPEFQRSDRCSLGPLAFSGQPANSKQWPCVPAEVILVWFFCTRPYPPEWNLRMNQFVFTKAHRVAVEADCGGVTYSIPAGCINICLTRSISEMAGFFFLPPCKILPFHLNPIQFILIVWYECFFICSQVN